MKTSFVQIFDKKDDAITAASYMSDTFPDHEHEVIDSSRQIQVWTKVGSEQDGKTYGAPDDKVLFMVLSKAK